ncbi:DEAD/DEAH box helicase [Cellulomonas chengniuliangii]|uniref:DEAD/DEAH box helicase n=1 Tax=Cellulomonas chengniuliangii TaxID=2968084 RepID=A0ABY5KYX7_9CELL|nr:DEAD/DEAH box helicase [Cellulomonas chengniuliangii]MCC2307505.1 DEAD/DEAH box helicase [Cellulomonas chengniuliangii]UUI75721.1 DEAD/DEAH box helicase [Cellulomonas chengniuliangii]
MSFSALGVPETLVAALTTQGIAAPFPIQTATLPDTLSGRDVLGRGRTGSGKTLAFSLPMVARLAASTGARRPARPRGLVLAPTRELATQIAATLEPLARAERLSLTTVFGGVSQNRQVSALNGGIDILVACPGRLEDLIKQRLISLEGVEITVLDEADHMADLGFLPGVKRLMDQTPKNGQRMLFSATLDNGVDQIVKRYLHNPLTHSVDSAESPVAKMTHHVLAVADAESKRLVINELASGTGRRVLFTRTKHQAKKLAKALTATGIPAVDLHGNLSQPARERNLEAFSSGSVRVLVATDIAARGIHVDHIELVVHVDPPAEHKAYLHRSGRTARAGEGGDVVTVMLPEQAGDVRTLTRQAKITVQPQQVRPGSAVVARLVGEVAAHVEPALVVVAEPGRRGGAPSRDGAAGGPSRRRGGRGRSAGGQGGGQPGAGSGGQGGARGRGRTGSSAAPQRSATGGSRPVHSTATPGSGSSSRGGGVAMSMGSSAGRRRGR